MTMTGPTTVFHPTAFDWRPPTLGDAGLHHRDHHAGHGGPLPDLRSP